MATKSDKGERGNARTALGEKSILQLHVRADGARRLVGEPPSKHTFSARWLQREIGRLAEVRIVVTTDEREVTYRVTGYEPVYEPDGVTQARDDSGEARWNFTGLEAVMVEE